jgi:hypothetical protein
MPTAAPDASQHPTILGLDRFQASSHHGSPLRADDSERLISTATAHRKSSSKKATNNGQTAAGSEARVDFVRLTRRWKHHSSSVVPAAAVVNAVSEVTNGAGLRRKDLGK